jgi:hypothetical protein
MKIQQKVNLGILALAVRIQEKYPELASYFEQMPEIESEQDNKTESENGNDYRVNKERYRFSMNGRFPI